MIASEILSHVVPVLKMTDSCQQALSWMEMFRVSHLPVADDNRYLGLLSDEHIYSYGNLNDAVSHLKFPVEGTFVYEDFHIYDVIRLASSGLLSVVPVLSRDSLYMGSILLNDILHKLDKLLCVDQPGGIIILEVNSIDYSLAEIAQVVEYNEAKVLSCYVTANQETRQLRVTLKVNTAGITPILDTFFRYGYTIRDSFVAGEEQQDVMKERYGQLMKYLSM